MTSLIMAGGGPALAHAAYLPPVRLADGTLIPQGEKKRLLSREGVEELEGALLHVPGSTTGERLKLIHRFEPGVYIREIHMPKGEFVIGAEHTTRHWNVIISGRASVIMEGEVHEIEAPHAFISNARVRKVLKIHEDCIWQTLHANPTEERDTAKLEASLCVMSESYKAHFSGMKPITEGTSQT